VTHRIEIRWARGDEASIDATATETVLEAAERGGVTLPFGCRTGSCTTCVGRLVAGDVRYRRPPRSLRGHQIRDGFVLLCIAEPRGDCRFVVGPDVQSQLVSNPWKRR
jgi:ferredoxin